MLTVFADDDAEQLAQFVLSLIGEKAYFWNH